jgi:hypothetical protein
MASELEVGKVKVGTSTSTDTITGFNDSQAAIVGGDNVGLALQSTNSNKSARVRFFDHSGNQDATVGFDNSNSNLFMGTGTATHLAINTSGTVNVTNATSTDIGTLSNATQLYLENSTANKPVGITFGASNAAGGPSGTGTSSARVSALTSGGVGVFDADLVFETRSGSTIAERMRIASSGAVSIPSASGSQIALTVKGGNNLVDNIALNITNQAGDSGTNIRNNGQLFASTLATFSGGIKSEKGILSGTVLIDDDAVTTITPPRKGGFMKLIVDSATAEGGEYPQTIYSGEVYYDCGTSLAISKNTGDSAISGQLDVSTSDVSGSTGTNGNVTIAVQSGVIKIENRSAGQKRFNYFLNC